MTLRPDQQFRYHQTANANPDSQVPGRYSAKGEGKEESELFQFRGPGWVRREIAKMIESKKFPHLETASDLLRQAVINEVEYLISQDYVPTSVWAQMRILDEMNATKRQELRFQKVAREFDDNIRGFIAEGAFDECASMLTRFKYYVSKMPECRFKERWKKEVARIEDMVEGHKRKEAAK